MKDKNTIPIIVGVTGHRAIREEDKKLIYAAVKQELETLQTLCYNSPLVMLNSLAEGGDLLCADAAAELDIPLIAALPMEREIYEKDFSEAAREHFATHCAKAEQVFVTPPTEAAPENGVNRNYLFRQAGIYVSAHCHILLALWDGGPGTKAACGTAEAVDFALNGSYYPTNGVSLRSDSNEAVIHVFTPRGDRTGEKAGTVYVLGNWPAVRDVLAKTDEFNRLASALPEQTRKLLPEDRSDDLSLDRMEKIYLAASTLSSAAAKKYRRVLALLAIASTILTLAFLLYDEAQAIWMIFVCGAMLLAAWGCQRYAARSDCHRRYIEYRALAECLRVQAFLRYAGSHVQATDQLTWTQQEETAWIMDALCTLGTGSQPDQLHEIQDCWVEKQREYHHWAGEKSRHDFAVSEGVVKIALILSVAFYLAAVIFEMLCGGLIFTPSFHVADVEIYRTILKIAMGSISAATLFIANYYGRLSLPRTLSDHTKMERFYSKMSAQLKLRGQTDELLAVLAREELIENGNWYSYQRDNKPDVSI